ncbi:hypothetical protein THAOC_21197, partial [Thalassiosira oceanica]
MGKKGKRSRNAAAVSDESAADDSSSAASAPPPSDAASRKPPALRTTAEETADDLRCEDPYGDVLEDPYGDDESYDSYEEVYESSGDEDEEYMEAMASGDGERAAGLASSRMDTDGGDGARLPAIEPNHGECPPSQ